MKSVEYGKLHADHILCSVCQKAYPFRKVCFGIMKYCILFLFKKYERKHKEDCFGSRAQS